MISNRPVPPCSGLRHAVFFRNDHPHRHCVQQSHPPIGALQIVQRSPLFMIIRSIGEGLLMASPEAQGGASSADQYVRQSNGRHCNGTSHQGPYVAISNAPAKQRHRRHRQGRTAELFCHPSELT